MSGEVESIWRYFRLRENYIPTTKMFIPTTKKDILTTKNFILSMSKLYPNYEEGGQKTLKILNSSKNIRI